MDDWILKQHFCLQYLTAVAMAARIELPLNTSDNAPIDTSHIREIIAFVEEMRIITSTSASYLRGLLPESIYHRTNYNPQLANCSTLGNRPFQLYELLSIAKDPINIYVEIIPTWISESYLEVCMDIAFVTSDMRNPNPAVADLFHFYKSVINASLTQMSVSEGIQSTNTLSSSSHSTPTLPEKQLTVASTKQHFCLQFLTVLALQAQIDLSLEVQENVPISVTKVLKIIQEYENLSILTAAESTYLRACLSTDPPSSYNSILANSTVRSQVPMLYDLLGRSSYPIDFYFELVPSLLYEHNPELCLDYSVSANISGTSPSMESLFSFIKASLKPIMSLLNHMKRYW
jgi:hypothetical protein